MDKTKIIIDGNIEKEVDCIFYLYNSKYYFIYTEKDIDENNYVILNLVQVGKEIQNTPNGPIETGYMVGVEISDPEEWNTVQGSITKIVESKKTGVQNKEIQYLPVSMLNNLKIISKKTFRLKKSIVEENFGLVLLDQNLETTNNQNVLEINNNLSSLNDYNADIYEGLPNPGLNNFSGLEEDNQLTINSNNMLNSQTGMTPNDDVIIDYRAKFFEEQEKNQQLLLEIEELNAKIDSIKKVIE